jgi:hypothetical protein
MTPSLTKRIIARVLITLGSMGDDDPITYKEWLEYWENRPVSSTGQSI